MSRTTTAIPNAEPARLADFIRLARPLQWAKGVFVLIGPAYGLAARGWMSLSAVELQRFALGSLAAFLAFGFASSACYVINDALDREADRAHPRKRNRPIAAGRITLPVAAAFMLVLLACAAGSILLVPGETARTLLGACVGVYVANVVAYSMWIKHLTVADTISLAAGFVLRVLGGCAAVLVEPSSWLLNVTFFLSMFLALGKRLGERRTMGDGATDARTVQAKYTDDLLRMAVVVTGVATLLSYSDYVLGQANKFTLGFNLLWLTMLPATYGLLRCIVLVERGVYDDPTELAIRDRPFQLAGLAFVAITVALLVGVQQGWIGPVNR